MRIWCVLRHTIENDGPMLVLLAHKTTQPHQFLSHSPETHTKRTYKSLEGDTKRSESHDARITIWCIPCPMTTTAISAVHQTQRLPYRRITNWINNEDDDRNQTTHKLLKLEQESIKWNWLAVAACVRCRRYFIPIINSRARTQLTMCIRSLETSNQNF